MLSRPHQIVEDKQRSLECNLILYVLAFQGQGTLSRKGTSLEVKLSQQHFSLNRRQEVALDSWVMTGKCDLWSLPSL